MERFTKSLRSSVAHKDWYVALATALTLPDVCGRLINPALKSTERYSAWFDAWVSPGYTVEIPSPSGVHCFLTGADCYALRCSYLHEGSADITQQRVRKALDDFHFVQPFKNATMHRNQINNTLQLQVDIFCLDIAEAVDKWAASIANDVEIQGRMASLLSIHNHESGVQLS